MTTRRRLPFAEAVKEGLRQGIRQNRAERRGASDAEFPAPPRTYRPKDVAALRNSLDLSQSAFAALLRVSTKTVQSWEHGERIPSPSSARLLQLIEHPDLLSAFIAAQRQKAGVI